MSHCHFILRHYVQYREMYLELILSYFYFQNHDIGQSKSKSNDTAIPAYHREHNTSLSSDVQTLKIVVDTYKISQELLRDIYGGKI